MTLRALAAGAVAVAIASADLLGSSATAAVAITNRDDKDHKLTIIEGDARADHVLKPTQVLEGVCEKGCVIRLNDSDNDEYELDGTEVVSIEEGYLYYDGPDAPPENQGTADPKGEKKK